MRFKSVTHLLLGLTVLCCYLNQATSRSGSDWIENVLDEEYADEEKEEQCDKEDCIESLETTYKKFLKHVKQLEKKETSHYRFTVVDPVAFERKCCPVESAKMFLQMVNVMMAHNRNKAGRLSFAYGVDMTKEKSRLRQAYGSKSSKAHRKLLKLANEYDTSMLPPSEKRQFELLTDSVASKDPRVSKKLSDLSSKRSYIYGHATACVSKSKCLAVGEVGMEEFYRSTDDYDQLAAAWLSWRNVTGPALKGLYAESVKLSNIGPREHGYPDAGYYEYYSDMKDPNLPQTVMKLYREILPLYRELHAYVRFKLWEAYPGRFDKKGPIPAHILGNVWAQSFAVMDKAKPYPEMPLADITKTLESLFAEGELDEHGMFKIAEEFYTSIGMPPMTKTFWKKSVIKKEKNKVMQCHGSAYSMSNHYDFRIKMCTTPTHSDFRTVHHEMGHVQYYMAYDKQPFIFQSGACSGFHEAVGDTIALSVNTPEHLHRMKLLDSLPTSEKFDINYLMQASMDTIAFLPFALVADTWRWDVYRGTTTPSNYNKHWWKLRYELQGIEPPFPRTENDCDALSKYHIAVDVPYIRYFISHILQFQFYEALCNAGGNTKPLHRCDFYEKPVGKKFLSMLKLGGSESWQDALKVLTGTREIKTDAILRYFRPLYKWLKKTNRRKGIHVGW